jgi:hypothetical protein
MRSIVACLTPAPRRQDHTTSASDVDEVDVKKRDAVKFCARSGWFARRRYFVEVQSSLFDLGHSQRRSE